MHVKAIGSANQDFVTGETDLQALFEQRYADEPFVDLLPAGQHDIRLTGHD